MLGRGHASCYFQVKGGRCGNKYTGFVFNDLLACLAICIISVLYPRELHSYMG